MLARMNQTCGTDHDTDQSRWLRHDHCRKGDVHRVAAAGRGQLIVGERFEWRGAFDQEHAADVIQILVDRVVYDVAFENLEHGIASQDFGIDDRHGQCVIEDPLGGSELSRSAPEELRTDSISSGSMVSASNATSFE